MLFFSGSAEYVRATTPHNSITAQHPFAVAVPQTADELAEVVRGAASSGHEIVVQATGHGAGAEVGETAILIDTSRLDRVVVNPAEGTAVVGSGAVWSAVNAEAERHRMLGLAGSAPSVAVSGYTFGGGIGWLARSNGLASNALRRVTYVDGSGAMRVASDDAADELDRDAMWVFRGGGGVGVAVELEFDLAPVADLHAGYLLWPADAVHDVVSAWAAATATVGAGVSSSIGVLRLPPAPAFPEELRGRFAVHLALATPADPAGADAMLDAVRAAATPLVDTWGPSDAARLSGIHLDPPIAVPAYGDAGWFTAATPDVAAAVLATALADGSPLAMMELRHAAGPVAPTAGPVAGPAASATDVARPSSAGVAPATLRPGAVTAAPSPFVYHAVGALQAPGDRDALDAAFARARWAAGDADSAFPLASWMEGASHVVASLPPADLARAVSVADRVDPDHRLRRPRGLPA